MDDGNNTTPEVPQQPERNLSFVERTKVSPIAFALLCLLGVFILYQVIGGVLTYFLIGAKVTVQNVMAQRTFTMVGQTVFILVPTLLFAKLLDRKLSAVFPWRMPRIGETVFATLGLLFLQEVFQIYLFFQDRIPLPETLRKMIDPLKHLIEEMFRILVSAHSIPELLFVILVVAVTPAIVEELLFRGLIQSSFERAVKPVWAAIITGIIFGAFHFNPFAIVPLIVLGCYFGILRMRSKSLVITMTVHFLNNLTAVVVAYFSVDDKMIIGATQGPEVNTAAILVQLVLFLGLFVLSFGSYLRLTSDLQSKKEL